jgi:hypothetical protein
VIPTTNVLPLRRLNVETKKGKELDKNNELRAESPMLFSLSPLCCTIYKHISPLRVLLQAMYRAYLSVSVSTVDVMGSGD